MPDPRQSELPRFDLQALFGAIEARKDHQDLTWIALGRQVGVSPSTIRRFRDADDAEADGVLALIGWLNDAPEDYVKHTSIPGTPLPDQRDGYVRVDMELVAQANGDPRGARQRTRTTIQTLTNIAQHARQPIASLTQITKT